MIWQRTAQDRLTWRRHAEAFAQPRDTNVRLHNDDDDDDDDTMSVMMMLMIATSICPFSLPGNNCFFFT